MLIEYIISVNVEGVMIIPRVCEKNEGNISM